MEIYNQSKVTITPDMASEMLQRNVKNRPASKWYIAFLSDQIQQGNWQYNGQPIIFGVSGNLLDGQHRLFACVKSGLPIVCDIKTGVPDESFATIDDRKGRSNRDVFYIEGVVNANQIAAVVTRYNAIMQNQLVDDSLNNHGVGGTKRLGTLSRQDALTLYYKHQLVFDNVVKLGQRCYEKRRILTATAMSAYSAFLIIDKKWSYEAVESFFYQICGDESDCPKVSLLSKILTNNAISQRKMSPILVKVYIIKAWNAYVTGDKRKLLSYHPETEQVPDFISNESPISPKDDFILRYEGSVPIPR